MNKQISRNSSKSNIDNSQLIDEFERLCEGFKFTYLWDNPKITPETFLIYAINVPAKEASCDFIYSADILNHKNNRNKRKSIDFKRHMYYNQEW